MEKSIKKFGLALLVFCSLASTATHNRSGELLYSRVAPFIAANGSPVYTYSFTLITYTDHGPNVADRCFDTVYFGDGSMAVFSRVNSSTLTCQGCANCGEIIDNDPNYVVKKNIYTGIHTYAAQGHYVAYMMDPNRNAGVHNIPNSDQQPFYVESLVIAGPLVGTNSSPVLTRPPVDRALVGHCFYYNPCAYDPDGDSLSYELVPCKVGPNQIAPGYSFPETGSTASPGSLIMDSITGLLSWCNPQFSDQYDVAILIKEWRQLYCHSPRVLVGSVTRDMQIIVSVDPAPLNFPGPFTLNDTCLPAGTTFFRTLTQTASIPNAAAPTIHVSLQGAPVNISTLPLATISPTSGIGSITFYITWQTVCGQARSEPYPAELVYQVPTYVNSRTFYRQFNITLLPPQPTNIGVAGDTSRVTLYWNNYSTSCLTNLNGYYIYRKIGPNSWSHGPCETGVPPSSGFQRLDFRNKNDNSYTDVNLWNVPTGSTVNYIVTTLLNDCSESFGSNIQTLSVIVGIKPENGLYESAQIFPNPFSNSVNISLGENYNGIVETVLYSAEGKKVFENSTQALQGRFDLALGELKPGIYIAKEKTTKGVFYRKLVRE